MTDHALVEQIIGLSDRHDPGDPAIAFSVDGTGYSPQNGCSPDLQYDAVRGVLAQAEAMLSGMT